MDVFVNTYISITVNCLMFQFGKNMLLDLESLLVNRFCFTKTCKYVAARPCR